MQRCSCEREKIKSGLELGRAYMGNLCLDEDWQIQEINSHALGRKLKAQSQKRVEQRGRNSLYSRIAEPL
jgi:hypothetical protein